jgi:hypothetical protein
VAQKPRLFCYARLNEMMMQPRKNRRGDQWSPVLKIGSIIQQMKGYASRQVGFTLWQKGFYDYVIRNEQDYLARWKYIDENPLKWQDDELFQD